MVERNEFIPLKINVIYGYPFYPTFVSDAKYEKKANSVHALLRSVHTSTNLVVEYQFRVYKIRMIFA